MKKKNIKKKPKEKKSRKKKEKKDFLRFFLTGDDKEK